MRLGTLFSGIGAPEQGAKRVYGDDFKLVFACEWDKFARQSFKANYNLADEHFHTDINDMDGSQYKDKVDVIVGGSPCQDFSIAGLRAGVEGRRGQLIWQYFRIINEVMPPIFIYENVKGFVSDKNGKTLKDFLEVFRSIGYNCHWEVVNTKDYGVPQNRERIYIVGFLDADMYYRFQFAPTQKLIKRLRDVLEPNVDEKYYLSKKAVDGFKQHTERMQEKGNGFKFEPTDGNCVASSVTTRAGQRPDDNFLQVKSATKQGYELAAVGNSINLSMPKSETRRGRVGKQVAQTLDCACNQAVVEPKTYERAPLKFLNRNQKEIECDYAFTIDTAQTGGIKEIENDGFRIRKLTPRECLRLQDFPDTFKQVVRDSQMYKQAGNSMSVNILEMIFESIELCKRQDQVQARLF